MQQRSSHLSIKLCSALTAVTMDTEQPIANDIHVVANAAESIILENALVLLRHTAFNAKAHMKHGTLSAVHALQRKNDWKNCWEAPPGLSTNLILPPPFF